jgi:hypothetical protein
MAYFNKAKQNSQKMNGARSAIFYQQDWVSI